MSGKPFYLVRVLLSLSGLQFAHNCYCTHSADHATYITLDSRASTFHTEKRLVKLRVETRATFATIFVATNHMRLPQDH